MDLLASALVGLFTGIHFVGLVIGSFVLFYLAKGGKKPMDDSNIFNHLRLIWWAVSQPHKFTAMLKMRDGELVPAFPWLEFDEGDIVEGKVHTNRELMLLLLKNINEVTK